MNPSRYIEQVDPKTGNPVDRAVEPHELLIDAHRNRRSKPVFRYKPSVMSDAQVASVRAELRREASAALARTAGRLKVLVTGGTGFVGKEILWQAAREADIAELIVLIRPKTVREKISGRVIEVITPQRRGLELLAQLDLTSSERDKFRFIAGDVEQANLGIDAEVAEGLRAELTHVIHCAANVAFDDTYQRSFRANVDAAVHALEFSSWLQQAEGSRFVAHLAIETSYLHGRCGAAPATEGSLAFPSGFFNNYYELTKAMASLETRRYELERHLRVVELCPAIVIGDSRTGNNRGDTKVVNAPVNLFGCAKDQLERSKRGRLWQRLAAPLLARVAFAFPAHATAELNLVPVDWVARGIVAALRKPQSVGRRIHLATDARVSALQMQRILREELQISLRLSDPVLHRKVVLPLACALLKLFRHDRMARSLQRLGSIFAGYSEAGQPKHEVGNDVALLGLPAERPTAADALRMLCRHNQWAQDFGRVRDTNDITRRERVWAGLVEQIERRAARPAARIAADQFHSMVAALLDAGALMSGERGQASVAQPGALTLG